MQNHHQAHAAGFAAPEVVHHDPAGLAPLGAAAPAPGGVSMAPNDEGPTGTNGQAFKDQKTADTHDCAAAHIAEQDKAFGTARAKLALAGWCVHIVDGGNGAAAYWVSRWGQSRMLPDWHALVQFMRQVGCAS